MVAKVFTIKEDELIRGVLKKDYIDTCLSLEKPGPVYQCVQKLGKYFYTVEWETEVQWDAFLNHVQILGYISLEQN